MRTTVMRDFYLLLSLAIRKWLELERAHSVIKVFKTYLLIVQRLMSREQFI
jgi:hypothetical protein